VDRIIISLKINLFWPCYCWQIAELALSNNHSLTFMSGRWMPVVGIISSDLGFFINKSDLKTICFKNYQKIRKWNSKLKFQNLEKEKWQGWNWIYSVKTRFYQSIIWIKKRGGPPVPFPLPGSAYIIGRMRYWDGQQKNINLFWPCYCWQIAELALSNNHSLTFMSGRWMPVVGIISSDLSIMALFFCCPSQYLILRII
jgi:hypothetical protein